MEMVFVTKKNGNILIRLGIGMTVISFLIMMLFPSLVYSKIEGEYVYTPLASIVYTCFFFGPILMVIGIPIYIVSAKRIPAKMMGMLRSNIYKRAKISFLAQQLAISEKDVITTVSRLRSRGEPILFDDSTLEVFYDPALPPPPPTEFEKPIMNPYEKLQILLAVLAIIVSVLLALLR